MRWGALKNAGAWAKALFGAINKTATAGGAGDNTAVNGGWIDRLEFHSLKVAIGYTAALGEGNTLRFAGQLQHNSSPEDTGAASFGAAIPTTLAATGAAGGSTETGTVEADYDLTMAKRYIRFVATPDLNRANTDTTEWAMVYLLMGGEGAPVSRSIR